MLEATYKLTLIVTKFIRGLSISILRQYIGLSISIIASNLFRLKILIWLRRLFGKFLLLLKWQKAWKILVLVIISWPCRRFRIEISAMRTRALFFHHMMKDHLEIRGVLTDMNLIIQRIIAWILRGFASTKSLVEVIVVWKCWGGMAMVIEHFSKRTHGIERLLPLNFLDTTDRVCVKIVVTIVLIFLPRIRIWRSHWNFNDLAWFLPWHWLRKSRIPYARVFYNLWVQSLYVILKMLIITRSSFQNSISKHFHTWSL